MSQDTDRTELLRQRAQAGDRSAVWHLVEYNLASLRRWAHRKLPHWARAVTDTSDVIQDAILRTVGRIDRIDISERGALQAYLRQAINNRINDEFRRVTRRGMPVPLDEEQCSAQPSPFESTVAADLERRYKAAVAALGARDRLLVVGHVEMDYTLKQLACVSGRTVAGTRMALRRALVKLADEMGRHE